MASFNIKQRKKARYVAVQAIYQWELTDCDPQELIVQFLIHEDNQRLDRDYFQKAVMGVIDNYVKLDAELVPFLDRPIQEVNPIELSILRLGMFELQHALEIPYKVVINEAVELTKTFGATDSFRYINGVLDKAAGKLRSEE